MSLLDRAQKAVTYLAENSGVIVVNTQRSIEGRANPKWTLEKIKEETFNTKDGENTREVITYITQPTRTQYQPILGAGNEVVNQPNPQTLEATNVTGDAVGRGCSIPADTMAFGYDVRTSCLKARAVEIGPFCVIDLIRKNAFKTVITRLWEESPEIFKQQFARQLLREIINLGKFKFSVANGIPYVTDQPGFPTLPTGGPDIGAIRRIERVVRPWGWDEHGGSPMMDGKRTFSVMMGADAVEWAVETRKNNKGYKIETTRTADDKVFGKTMVYEGIQMLSEDRPMRVILIATGVNSYLIEEIEPTIVVPAEAEGFKEVPNQEYDNDYAFRGGSKYRIFEVGFYLANNALVRESMGALPTMPGGKTFDRKFDFSIKPIPDFELAAKGCNKDLFYFGYRMLHAFAMKRRRYELAGAFLYIAPKPRFDIIDPWIDLSTPAPAAPAILKDLLPPPVAGCEPCIRPEALAREPVMPTCDELFPDNGVGTISLYSSAALVEETAGNLTIVVQRVGGTDGAASCVVTITEGTATNPENFTTPAGFAGVGPWTKTLNWADEVGGNVSFNIPIVNRVGNDDGKQFTVGIGTFVGATAGAVVSETVTILDADEVPA